MSFSDFPFKAVLFDIDNTILDFDACVKETLKKGFEDFHLPAYEPWMFGVFTQINNALWARLERKEITRTDLFARRFPSIFDVLHIEADAAAFERYFRQQLYNSSIPIDGAEHLLSALSGRTQLGVASNGPYAQQMHRLEAAGFTRFFTYFFISEQVGYSKPDSRFFDCCISAISQHEETPVLPGQILMIGDSLTSDMDGGIAARFSTCYFDRHKTGAKGRAVDYQITALSELESILR